jgi:acyl-CoA thioesterase
LSNPLKELRKSYEDSPFFQHIGFDFVELEEGKVTLKLDIHEALLNTLHMLHGGVYAAMIDNIIGLTARSITNRPLVTVQLYVPYLEAVKEGSVYAVAKMNRVGHSIISGEGEIIDKSGKVLAKGSGTFKQVSSGR